MERTDPEHAALWGALNNLNLRVAQLERAAESHLWSAVEAIPSADLPDALDNLDRLQEALTTVSRIPNYIRTDLDTTILTARPSWGCDQWGQPGHDWLNCVECMTIDDAEVYGELDPNVPADVRLRLDARYGSDLAAFVDGLTKAAHEAWGDRNNMKLVSDRSEPPDDYEVDG